MSINLGDGIPDVEVRVMGPDRPTPVRTRDVLGDCSAVHLPGFVERLGDWT